MLMSARQLVHPADAQVPMTLLVRSHPLPAAIDEISEQLPEPADR